MTLYGVIYLCWYWSVAVADHCGSLPQNTNVDFTTKLSLVRSCGNYLMVISSQKSILGTPKLMHELIHIFHLYICCMAILEFHSQQVIIVCINVLVLIRQQAIISKPGIKTQICHTITRSQCHLLPHWTSMTVIHGVHFTSAECHGDTN